MHRFFDRRRRGPSRFLVLLALLALAGTACADVVVPEAPAGDEAPAEDEVPASEAPAEDDAAEEAPAEDGVPASEAPAGEAPAEEAPAGDAAAGSGGLTEAQVADLLEGIESEISIAQLRSLCDNAVLRSLAAAQIAASGDDVPADVLDQLCAVVAAG